MAQGHGLGRKHLVFEDKGGKTSLGYGMVQPGSTRLPNGIRRHLFTDDEASGHRAAGPNLMTCPKAPKPALSLISMER